MILMNEARPTHGDDDEEQKEEEGMILLLIPSPFVVVLIVLSLLLLLIRLVLLVDGSFPPPNGFSLFWSYAKSTRKEDQGPRKGAKISHENVMSLQGSKRAGTRINNYVCSASSVQLAKILSFVDIISIGFYSTTNKAITKNIYYFPFSKSATSGIHGPLT
jgi:hypothetical protein